MGLPKEIALLAKNLGLEREDLKLLRQAVTHSSYVHEAREDGLVSNERLEFLGDAVLQLAVSQFLFLNYPGASEGELSRRRAQLVCEAALAEAARRLELGNYLFLSRGEELTGGRSKPSILADAFEALLGAIFLTKGWAAVRQFILETLASLWSDDHWPENPWIFDAKSSLQELAQSLRPDVTIRYVLLHEAGPDHDKTYRMGVVIDGRLWGEGVGKSKKEAEQAAARQAWQRLQTEKLPHK